MFARARLSTLIVLFLACGGPPLAGDTDDVEPLRWDISPRVARYHVTQSLRARVEADDGSVTGTWRRTELVSTLEMAAPGPDGRAQVTVTYDAGRGEVDDPQAGQFVFDSATAPAPADRSARAMAIRDLRQRYLDDAYSYTIDPRGEIEIVRAGANSLGEPLPDWVGPLPNSRLKVGDTWTHEAVVERPPLGQLRASTTFVMGETSELGPASCAEITFETRYAWVDPDAPGSGAVDPAEFRDEGRLCMGLTGLPLVQEFTARRQGRGRASDARIEFTQTRTLIPSTGPVPWTLAVPPGQPDTVHPQQPAKLEVAGPALPAGALLRLGSARGTFWSRIDLIEPAHAGDLFAVASGPTVTIASAASGDRRAAFQTGCGALADLVWTPDDSQLVGLCERDAADESIYVWRRDGTVARTITLPVAPRRISVARLENVATGFAVDAEGGLWRFPLAGEAPPQGVALSWPPPEPIRTGGDAGPPEDGGLYPEPNDPLLFTRFVVAPDGFQAAGVADGRLVLVDAGAQKVRQVMTDPEVVVRDLVWIPGRAGALIVAVDNRLEIWPADGDTALQGATVVLDGHPWEGAERLSISADGKRLLSWQADHGTTLWRVVGDKLVAEVLDIKAREDSALTADGRYVVSRSRHANALHAYDLKRGAKTKLTGAHGERIVDLAAAPDGRHVATADLDGWIQVWSAKGAPVGRFRVRASKQKYGDVVDTMVAFDKNEQLLVGHPLGGGFRKLSGARARHFEEGFWGIGRVLIDDRGRRAVTLHHGYNGVRVWSLEGRDPRELWGERGEPYGVYSGSPYVCGVDLARGGSRVAIQWSDGRVQVRTIDGGAPTLTVFADPSHCRAALSGNGRRLAYLDAQSASIRVVDLKKRLKAELPGSRGVLYGPLLLDDTGERLVAGRGRSVRLFQLGNEVTTTSVPVPEGEVARLVALGDDRFVSTTAQATSALVWAWPPVAR